MGGKLSHEKRRNKAWFNYGSQSQQFVRSRFIGAPASAVSGTAWPGVSTTLPRSASWYSKPLIYPGQWCLAQSSLAQSSQRRFVGRMGVKRPEMGSKRRFFGESATWLRTAQLLL